MRLKDPRPFPPTHEWDRTDPGYDDPLWRELIDPPLWLGALVFFAGFLAFCVLMIVTVGS